MARERPSSSPIEHPGRQSMQSTGLETPAFAMTWPKTRFRRSPAKGCGFRRVEVLSDVPGTRPNGP